MKQPKASAILKAPKQLDPAKARRIVLHAQRLATPPAFGGDVRGVLDCIEHLGYVQIDAISVVQRAHLHTLWVRTGATKVLEHLHSLQREKRKIYEYWSHAAALLPMRDYRFSLPLKEFFKKRTKARGIPPEMQRLKRRIVSQVKANGAMRARDFEAPPNFKGGGWWQHKPAKRALSSLFFHGDLMISHRDGFEKFFDIRQRLLPSDTNTDMPSPEEEALHMINTAIRAQGIITYDDLLHPLRCTGATKHRALAQKLRLVLIDEVNKGNLLVRLVGTKTSYLRPQTSEKLPTYKYPTGPMTILSPFDNMIIHRPRPLWLFGFDYSIECYVPEAKRQFGYFSLPILDGELFFGRLDAKADQNQQLLNIKSLHLEPGISTKPRTVERLLAGLRDFAVFNGCREIVFVKSAATVLSLRKLRYSAS